MRELLLDLFRPPTVGLTLHDEVHDLDAVANQFGNPPLIDLDIFNRHGGHFMSSTGIFLPLCCTRFRAVNHVNFPRVRLRRRLCLTAEVRSGVKTMATFPLFIGTCWTYCQTVRPRVAEIR